MHTVHKAMVWGNTLYYCPGVVLEFGVLEFAEDWDGTGLRNVGGVGAAEHNLGGKGLG